MRAPAFVYVVPAQFEDILKIGFSRKPARRIRTFHKRYFEYFDLERGFLLRANDAKDAHRLEQWLASRFAAHRTHAPLVIEQAPAGTTEWYRGAYQLVRQVSEQIVADGGYPPLISAAALIREELLREREHLFEHATAVLDSIDAWGDNDQGREIAAAFRNALDAFRAFDIPVHGYLSDEVKTRLGLE